MPSPPETPATISEYISRARPDARPILEKIRALVRSEAPEAEELISYRMPAFRINGILLYFAAFKNHIGLYPPVKGDAKLKQAIEPYAGPKDNLRFPLDQPIPYALIRRIVRLRIKQDGTRAAARTKGARAS